MFSVVFNYILISYKGLLKNLLDTSDGRYIISELDIEKDIMNVYVE